MSESVRQFRHSLERGCVHQGRSTIQQAKAFFYVCVGLFLLALTYHLRHSGKADLKRYDDLDVEEMREELGSAMQLTESKAKFREVWSARYFEGMPGELHCLWSRRASSI